CPADTRTARPSPAGTTTFRTAMASSTAPAAGGAPPALRRVRSTTNDCQKEVKGRMSAKKSAATGGAAKLAKRGFALAVVAAVVLGFGAAGCTRVSTAPDEVVLHYAGGLVEPNKVGRCISPSSGATHLGPGCRYFGCPFRRRALV